MSNKMSSKKYLIVVVVSIFSTGGSAKATFASSTSVNLGVTVATTSLAQGDVWTEKAPMPTARLGVSCSAVNGKIYTIGGYAAANSPGMRTVEEYDPATDTWTTKADMPTGRRWFSTSVVNGKIYALGGYTNYGQPGLSTVEEYDPATDTWTTKTPMPTARLDLATSVVNGIIYAVGGGATVSQRLRTVEAYDPLTDTWITKANMPTPARLLLSTSVVDGKIYAIGGGGSSASIAFSVVQEYDPATDTWTSKTSIPTARHGHSACVVNGEIYVIGGYDGNQLLSTVVKYNPATDTWMMVTGMPEPKSGLGSSTVNGKIYAIGGMKTSGGGHPGVTTVYEYDPNPLVVDFNGDEIVNSKDFSMLAQYWYRNDSPFVNHRMDYEYLTGFAEHWLEDYRLVAHWKLNETEGTIAYDSIGSNDGTLNGDLNWQPTDGKVDGALKFNGIGNYISTDFVLNPVASFSAFVWIKGGVPGQVIISQADRRAGRNIIPGSTWLGTDLSEGRLMTRLMDTFFPPLESESVITDDQWHHIGLVYDFEQFHRHLYVDGAEVAKDTDIVGGVSS
ncbi:MAG: Kelch repeat-containing protein, partial [Planctomycetota bacterium]